jgi:hypothetical protein
MWSTADGRSWTRIADISTKIASRQEIVRLASGPPGMLAWIPQGRAWWSTDGKAWRRTTIRAADAAGIGDAAVGADGVIVVGSAGGRGWVASSPDGTTWPRSGSTDLGRRRTLGTETAVGAPALVWAGRERLVKAPGSWEVDPSGDVPDGDGLLDLVGGPRGYLALGGLERGTGAHRAWTSDGRGAWIAVEGSSATRLDRAGAVELLGVVPDEAGWLIVARDGARLTGWRVTP